MKQPYDFSDRLHSVTKDAIDFLRSALASVGGKITLATEAVIEEMEDEYYELPELTVFGKHGLNWNIKVCSIEAMGKEIVFYGVDTESLARESVTLEYIDRDGLIWLAPIVEQLTENPQPTAEKAK